MTDNLPQNATSRPSVSALPEPWICKIFRRLEGRYGSLFLDRWSRCDMANVKAVWAEELAGFQDNPAAIGYALKALQDQQFPPTLPEFLAACRRAPGMNPLALITRKPTPEEAERSREMAEKAARAVKKSAEYDGLLWAKRPRSQCAMDRIADARKHPARFRELADVFDRLVIAGVCNEAGKLLKRWDGSQWAGVRA